MLHVLGSREAGERTLPCQSAMLPELPCPAVCADLCVLTVCSVCPQVSLSLLRSTRCPTAAPPAQHCTALHSAPANHRPASLPGDSAAQPVGDGLLGGHGAPCSAVWLKALRGKK